MLHADIHSHLMPGVDDGARSPVETIAMAQGLVDLGVERVYLTPHQYKLGNAFTPVEIKRNTDTVWRTLARAGINLEVRPGAEYYYGEQLLDAIASGQELIPFDWDDEPCLLVELPMHQRSMGVRRVGAALERRGIRPVLAHPERTTGLSREWERVEAWLDAGWRLQLNLLSLVGKHGREAEQNAYAMLEAGWYDFAGSDLHRPAQLDWLRQAHEAFRSVGQGVPQP